MVKPKLTLQVVEWAAEECTRQRSGEMSVHWMLQGWEHVVAEGYGWPKPHQLDLMVLPAMIKGLAGIVEPRHNTGTGWRRVNVRVGWEPKGSWRSVPRQMQNLCNAIHDLEPDDWYRQFEEVHPFRDGNGRTGSILWNWLKGTLAEPDAPPDFWSGPEEQDRQRLAHEIALGVVFGADTRLAIGDVLGVDVSGTESR